MVTLIFLSFLLALVLCFVLVRRTHLIASNYGESKPQRFHAGDIPRMGGLAIMLSMP